MIFRFFFVSLFLITSLAKADFVAEKIVPSNSKSEMTMIVYMGADNSLDKAAWADLAEMQKFGPPTGVDLVVFHDGKAKNDTFRAFVTKGKVHVEMLPEVNSADPKVVVDFVKWATKVRPSKKYMFVFWDHGLGVLDALPPTQDVRSMKRSKAKLTKSIIDDDTSGNEITFTQMKTIIKTLSLAGIKIDILGFDACLMGMVEIVYDLADLVDTFIGSEQTEPGAGWPYDRILSGMTSVDNKFIGKLIVTSYLDSYKAMGQTDVTLSAIDSKKLKTAVDQAFTPFFTKVLPASVKTSSSAKALFAKTQAFEVKDFIDLGDLFIQSGDKNANTLLTWMKSAIIATGKYGNEVKGAYGLSIYAPSDAIVKTYFESSFATKTGWGAFLKARIGKVVDPKYVD